nr:Protein phosphatase methylesterase 1 [Polyrhizophydium stewartii]
MDSHWSKWFETSRDVELPERGGTFRAYETRRDAGPVLVFHHGAGHSALIWALLVDRLLNGAEPLQCSILCFDARGHGATRTDSEEMPLATLADDLAALVQHLYPAPHNRDIFLVGHSLGGSVVVDAASRRLFTGLRGVVVIDVVEGTAIDALSAMRQILRARPESFPSIEAATKWAMRNNHMRNQTIAQLAMPDQLIAQPTGQFTWRTDLFKTSPHWEGWFLGLSEKFLSVRAGRLLVLAGKFQMEIYPESGHNVQEDAPGKLAATLIDFWKRNQSQVVIKRFPIPARPQ